jgi:hypothetical protein
VAVAAASVIALPAGCGAGQPPSVTFGSSVGSVSTGPAQYCDLAVTRCQDHPDAVVTLAVPPGRPLRVSVPDEVAEAPWQVVFAFRPPSGGEPVRGRSPVFAPNQRHDYALTLPDPGDQLLTAQVQQYGGATPVPGPDGGPTFAIRGSWVLTTG